MKRILCLVMLAGLSGCALFGKRKAPPPPPALRRLSDAEIPRFLDRMPKEPLVQAAQASIKYYEANPNSNYHLADAQYTGTQMADSLRSFIQLVQGYSDPATLDAALRENFDVFQSTGLDPDGRRLQEELCESLGATVHLKPRSGGKGSVVIDYSSLDELQGLLKRLKRS